MLLRSFATEVSEQIQRGEENPELITPEYLDSLEIWRIS
jgi:hypothetical protein